MDTKTFYLRVIASDKVFFEGKCKILVVPLASGEKAVLAHHEDMIIAVTVGAMRFQTEDDQWIYAAVGNGMVQIVNNRVTMLVDTAERPEEIDARRAEEARERAEEQLRQRQSLEQHSHSEASLARALARLRMKDRERG